jgi:hypothetical protein
MESRITNPDVLWRSQRTGEFLEAKIWTERLLQFTDKMPKLFSATFRLLFLFVWANSDRLTERVTERASERASEWVSEGDFVCLQQR